MDERRAVPRLRVLKAGTIAFNHGAGISCRVRNLSAAGACLEVTSPIGIPDRFVLAIDGEPALRPSRMVWRTENRIGVVFEPG
jgi:hypothetical protein